MVAYQGAATVRKTTAPVGMRALFSKDQFPLTTITGGNYDSGEYEKALDAALEASGYADLRAQQAERRASGDAKQLGIGVSAYVEVTAPVGLHVEWGACEVHEDGSATVLAGTCFPRCNRCTSFCRGQMRYPWRSR